MFENLKKKSAKKVFWISLLMVLGGVLIMAIMLPSILMVLKEHKQFESLSPEEITTNVIVDVELDTNLGCFMEEISENTTTHEQRTIALYYVIWTGDEAATDFRYMAIRVPAGDEDAMEAIAEATYLLEEIEPVRYSGKIAKMSDEEYQYLIDYLTDMGFTEEEIEEYTIPYYINVGAFVGEAAVHIIAVFLVGIALIIVAIIIYILALKGSGLKEFRKELEKMGLSELDVEREYVSSALLYKNNDLRMSNRLLFFMIGSKPHVIRNDKIIWVYQKSTTHRTNGIKTGTTYELIVCTIGSGVKYISLPTEEACNAVMQYMNQRMPWTIFGYSDELMKIYRSDAQKFLSLRYQQNIS